MMTARKKIAAALPAPRRLESERGIAWITESWPVFRGDPGLWILIVIVSFIASITVGKIPLIGMLVSQVLSSLVLGGVVLVARKIRRGEGVWIGDFIAVLGHRGIVTVVLVSLIGAALLALLAQAVVLYYLDGGGRELLERVESGGSSLELVSMFSGAVLLLSLLLAPVTAMLWFAVPLALLRGLGVRDTLKASCAGVFANAMPLLAYGVASLLFLVAAALPFLLGLLVALPMLGISMLLSFEDVFPEPADMPQGSGSPEPAQRSSSAEGSQ